MQEPETFLTLEAPGGLVRARAEYHDGKAERIFVQNVPSFTSQLDVSPTVEGLGELKVDTAYGGDSFVIVDVQEPGFSLNENEAHNLAKLGVQITNAANEQLGFHHPENPDWKHISFHLIAGSLVEGKDGLETGASVAVQPGKIDRSPTGTALCARMAVLHARGQMEVGGKPAIGPELSGRGWITGVHQHMLEIFPTLGPKGTN